MFDNSSNPWDRRKFLGAVLGSSSAVFGLVAPDKVLAARLINTATNYRHADYTRYVFGVNGPLDYKSFTLDNPSRLVVDLTQTEMNRVNIPPAPAGSIVSDVRVGVRDGYNLRIVFDLKAPVNPRLILLPPGDGQGYRLVVDLPHDKATTLVARDAADPDSKPKIQTQSTFRDLVIAIDPGTPAGYGGSHTWLEAGNDARFR
ncbi:MAG: hypothetical protein B7X28_05385 [Halothiobacillus sp. 13-55-253]|nr:MAG: hypothetical protein B7X28_05385 [Halothiobacillus sp. 13-55-253]